MTSNDVRVCVRLRPLARGERGGAARALPGGRAVACGAHTFTFDRVLPPAATQAEVYACAAQTVPAQVLGGYNACVLFYGQTGAGKTFTAEGPRAAGAERGVLPRLVEALFDGVAAADASAEFQLRVSYVEIYGEMLRDLLEPTAAPQVRERASGETYLAGATVCHVATLADVLEVLRVGKTNRATAATLMNAESSRSHSIFQLEVEQRHVGDDTRTTGRLYVVDLAGSERLSRTGAEGQQRVEAGFINQSLSALGNVINALTDGRSTHVPYRNSKLTRVLQDALGGNAVTTLVVCASEAESNEAETLSTLRFGARAKTIKNRAIVNEERSPAQLLRDVEKRDKLIVRLKANITELTDELDLYRGKPPPDSPASRSSSAAAAPAAGADSHGDSRHLIRVAELESALAEASSDAARLAARVDDLTEQLRECDAQIQEQFEVLAVQDDALKAIEQQGASLQAENEFMLDELATTKFELEQAHGATAAVADTAAAAADHSGHADDLRAEVERLTHEQAVKSKQLELRNARIRALEQRLRAAQEDKLRQLRSIGSFAMSIPAAQASGAPRVALRIARTLRGGSPGKPKKDADNAANVEFRLAMRV